jgi:molybdopterin/thiamine biosynthesis adenylyltransferase
MSLLDEEVERYARHIVLRGVGGPGQAKLKQSKVLVIGAGGLGAPLIQYLAAAGLGTIGIVDDDAVERSNLQRQVLYGTTDIGRSKAESACEAVGRLNPHVKAVVHNVRLDAHNADALVRAYDIVADGSDNAATRYAVSDACHFERRPLVSAAVSEYDASITTLRSYTAAPDGTPNPTFRCLFPNLGQAEHLPACAETGILGALTGLVGSLMALEVIRETLGGFGRNSESLVGQILLIDAQSLRFEKIRYHWDPNNPLNGARRPPSRDGAP